MPDFIGGDMIRGHIDSIILYSLLDGDKDTNRIREEIEQKGGGQFQLKQGTFYSALQRISKQGFVTEYRGSGSDGVRRKFFQLTEKGKAHIEQMSDTWSMSQVVINKLLDTKPLVEEKPQPQSEEKIVIPSFGGDNTQSDDNQVISNDESYEISDADLTLSEFEEQEKNEEHIVQPTDEELNNLLNILNFTSNDDTPQDFNKNAESYENGGSFNDFIDIQEPHTYNCDIATDSFVSSATKQNEDETKNDFIADDNQLTNGTNVENTHLADNATQPATQDDGAVVEVEDVITSVAPQEEKTNVNISTESNEENVKALLKTEDGKVIKLQADKIELVINSESINSQSHLTNNGLSQSSSNPPLEASNFEKTEHDYANNLDNQAANLSEPQISKEAEQKLQYEKFEQLVMDTSKIQRNDDVSESNDDFLKTDDIPDQRQYKEVLAKIFAKNLADNKNNAEKNNIKDESTAIIDEQNSIDNSKNNVVSFSKDNFDESNKFVDNIVYDESNNVLENEQVSDVIVDEIDFSDMRRDNKKTVQKEYQHNQVRKQKGIFDYSDIIALSEEEGFRVSTSDRTNKNELGKILINRLNFHTSLLFFVLLALETLLVGLTMDSVLKFGYLPYLIFACITFVYPLVCGIIYFISPRRVVNEVGTFKSAFETALIITLNLILLVLVVAVIINLDFSSATEISQKLFVPILIIINIPILTIFKYSLLEKQMFFS